MQERRVVGGHGERLHVVLAAADEADRARRRWRRGGRTTGARGRAWARRRACCAACRRWPGARRGSCPHPWAGRRRRDRAARATPRAPRSGTGRGSRCTRAPAGELACSGARRPRRASSRRRARARRRRRRRPGRGGSASARPTRRPRAAATPSGQPRTSSVPDMNETETTAAMASTESAAWREALRRGASIFRGQPGGAGGRHEVSEVRRPMTLAVVAEKPAVARDIAQVLGARTREEGCLRGDGLRRHLGHRAPRGARRASRARPALEGVAHGRCCRCCPTTGASSSRSRRATSSRTCGGVLQAPDVTGVICATDAGREGELIFRYIYEAARCKKPVRRLWISSLTPDAIARGFRDLRDGQRVRRARPGRARAQPGRLARGDEPLARVQHRCTTRCSRWAACRRPRWPCSSRASRRSASFVPEDYFEVVATFDARPRGRRRARRPASRAASRDVTYAGTWFRGDARRLPKDGVEAAAIVERVAGGRGAHRVGRARGRSACPRRSSTTSPSFSGTRTASTA